MFRTHFQTTDRTRDSPVIYGLRTKDLTKIITTFASDKSDNFKTMYNDIIQLLDQRRLKEAFVQLGAMASETDNWDLKSDIESLQNTYGYMLQYAAQGMHDPERAKMYASLRLKGYELADRAEFITRNRKEFGYFADKFRANQVASGRSLKELADTLENINQDMDVARLTVTDKEELNRKLLELNRHHENTLDELFDKIWTSPHWKEEEYKAATSILESVMLPPNDLAVMVTAVTLNLLRLFDPNKFRFLVNAYFNHSDVNVTERALVGIALITYYQEKRLSMYPDLTAIFSLYSEDEKFIQRLCDVQQLLLLSRETEKIDKKMREEILPQMMRNTRMMDPEQKIFDIEDLEDMEETNPEWNKNLDQMKDNIVEIGQLQMEGADTYMSTFSQLKGYAFFRQAAHWFYVFDRHNTAVSQVFRNKENETPDKPSFIEVLLTSTMFCNSDKYSMCLTLTNLPESQREILGMQMIDSGEANESLKQLEEDAKNARNPIVVCRQYLQDLYRFFKLWAYRSEQKDLFKDKLDLWNCAAIKPLLTRDAQLARIASHLFNKEYYEEAAQVYGMLSQAKADDAEVWQKLGFSLQKLKKYPEAIKALKQADMLKPDNLWTVKHLAQCYRRTRQYEEALGCFQQVEAMQPENLKLLMQIGQILVSLSRYDKALAYFFKVEYLEKSPANAQRAIGWCYFMTGKHEEAIRFYEKLTATDDAQTFDWMNLGHVYLTQGDMPQAIGCYKKAEKNCKSHDEFLKLYLADKPALLEQHITEENIYLVPDLILD